MADLATIERNLEAINRIVAKIHPLGTIVISAIGLLIKLAKKAKVEIGPFEQEYLQYKAAHAELGSAIAAFRAEFGTGAPTPPPTDGGTTTIGG